MLPWSLGIALHLGTLVASRWWRLESSPEPGPFDELAARGACNENVWGGFFC